MSPTVSLLDCYSDSFSTLETSVPQIKWLHNIIFSAALLVTNGYSLLIKLWIVNQTECKAFMHNVQGSLMHLFAMEAFLLPRHIVLLRVLNVCLQKQCCNKFHLCFLEKKCWLLKMNKKHWWLLYCHTERVRNYLCCFIVVHWSFIWLQASSQ